MFQKIKYFAAKIINWMIITNSKYVFVEPHHNGKYEKQDLINYSGDSVLTFLDYCIKSRTMDESVFFLVIYDAERMKILQEYLDKKNISNVRLLLHYSEFPGFKKKIELVKYSIKKMKSKTWICSSLEQNKKYALKSQNLVCLGYFVSFKSDYTSNSFAYDYLPKNWKLVCSSSVFDTVTKSAAFNIPYNCFMPLGLARNDYLFQISDKKQMIEDWIYKKTASHYSKIVIYAPTFRDYEKNSNKKRNVWGYDSNKHIIDVLEKNDAIVIAKMHSWQNMEVVLNNNQRVIFFEPSYDYTIYDIMTIADLLITDYSSIGLDFLLIDKPVIYNLYDKEEYFETRGMCVEPIEEICGGEIVENEAALADCINRCLKENYEYKEKERVKNLFFKYKDGNSCARICDYLKGANVI